MKTTSQRRGRATGRVVASGMLGPLRWLAVLALPLLGVGCAQSEDDLAGGGSECQGAKCDLADEDETGGEVDEEDDVEEAPEDFPQDIVELCEDRRADAFVEDRPAFERNQLRWSCRDVPDTHPDDRGQEYCEYFAVVQSPNWEASEVLGMHVGQWGEDGVTPSRLELEYEGIAALEDDPEAIVGQCVFTSWNADLDLADEYACDEETCPGDALFDIPLADENFFRMKLEANTYEAAVALVEECMDYVAGEGDPDDPTDRYHDDFMRACELNHGINETEYRKSDNFVCASAMRLSECGCFLTLRDAEFGPGLSQDGELGFPLGSWESPDALPPGCRYQDVVPGAKQLVTCELTALEVLDNAMELKSYCSEKYADDVVVHVPVPADAIRCEPDPDNEAYAHTCSDEPWVVTDYP